MKVYDIEITWTKSQLNCLIHLRILISTYHFSDFDFADFYRNIFFPAIPPINSPIDIRLVKLIPAAPLVPDCATGVVILCEDGFKNEFAFFQEEKNPDIPV